MSGRNSGPAELARKRGKLQALLAKPPDEAAADGKAAAFAGDVIENGDEIPAGRREIDETAHSEPVNLSAGGGRTVILGGVGRDRAGYSGHDDVLSE